MRTLKRREFLQTSALALGGAFLTSRLAFARTGPAKSRFVFIVMRGALDGLAAAPPYGDPDYAGLRRELALKAPGSPGGALPLNGFFGLHPSFGFLHDAYSARELVVFHAVASPYRERSHFDGQDVLENGYLHPHAVPTGWLNRALASLQAGQGKELGVALGQNFPLVMRGPASVTSWSPSKLAALDEDTLERITDLYAGDPLLASRLADALAADAIAGGTAEGAMQAAAVPASTAPGAAGYGAAAGDMTATAAARAPGVAGNTAIAAGSAPAPSGAAKLAQAGSAVVGDAAGSAAGAGATRGPPDNGVGVAGGGRAGRAGPDAMQVAGDARPSNARMDVPTTDDMRAGRPNQPLLQRGKPMRYTEVVRAAAGFLRRDDGPQVAVFDTTGWDTHANEGSAEGQLAGRLAALDAGLRTLKDELGPAWANTAVLLATEFGRTAATNGTRGTDHGTATTAFLLGGAVQGGRVLADWPGLSSRALYQGRDLKPTADLRSVLKGVLSEHLLVSSNALESSVFPNSTDARPIKGLFRA
jgi:uncharacterized protein (DUF1501 family)